MVFLDRRDAIKSSLLGKENIGNGADSIMAQYYIAVFCVIISVLLIIGIKEFTKKTK